MLLVKKMLNTFQVVFVNLIGFIFFHALFCFLVLYYGAFILKEVSILVYSQLQTRRKLDKGWILYVLQYLMVNHSVLIFTSLFAGLASVLLFFFFIHLFSKYGNNMTINEEAKFEDFDYFVQKQSTKILKLATLDHDGIYC